MKEKRRWIIRAAFVICSLFLIFYANPASTQQKAVKQEFLSAVKQGDVAKVRELLRKNPSLARVTDENGVSALLQAVYNGRNDVADLLLASVVKLNIFEASATGRTKRVRALLKANPDLANAFAPDGFTPLGLAAFFGHRETVEALVSGGAKVNLSSRNALKAVPLRSAAVAGHLEVAQFLIARGAEIDALGEGGYTPLHEVAGSGRIEFAKLLLNHGANINARGDDGKTPLTIALESNQTEMANFLRERGAVQ